MAGQGPNFQIAGISSLMEVVNNIKKIVDELPHGINQITQATGALASNMEGINRGVEKLSNSTGTVHGAGVWDARPPSQATAFVDNSSVGAFKSAIESKLRGMPSIYTPQVDIPESLIKRHADYELMGKQLGAASEKDFIRKSPRFYRLGEELEKAKNDLAKESYEKAHQGTSPLAQPPAPPPLSDSLSGKMLYSTMDRQIANVAAATEEGKRHLKYDLSDMARVQSESAKSAKELLKTGGVAEAATKSDSPVVKMLGAELKDTVKGFDAVLKNHADALRALEVNREQANSSDTKIRAQAESEYARVLENARKATEKLDETNKKLTRIQDQLPPGMGGGGGESGGGGFLAGLEKYGKMISAAATSLNSLYSAGKGIEVEARKEVIGKERGLYELQFGQQELAARRTIESYDLTKPENLLKYRGDIVAPGRYQFQGETGRKHAEEVAARETLDKLGYSRAVLEKATTQAVLSGISGVTQAAVGGAMMLNPATGAVGAIAGAQGMGMMGQGATQAVQSVQGYYQNVGQNEIAQLGGGIAGGWGGRTAWDALEAERRAAMNARVARERIMLDNATRANEIQQKEIEGDPLGVMAARTFQEMKQVEQQGVRLVGPAAAWRKEKFMTSLYGRPRSEFDKTARTLGKEDIEFSDRSYEVAKNATQITSYTKQLDDLSEERVRAMADTGVSEAQFGTYKAKGWMLPEAIRDADRKMKETLSAASKELPAEAFAKLGDVAIADAVRLGVPLPKGLYTRTYQTEGDRDYSDRRKGGGVSTAEQSYLMGLRPTKQDEEDDRRKSYEQKQYDAAYAKATQEGVARETAASRLGITAPELMAKANALSNVLGTGIQATIPQTENIEMLSRSGLGSFQQLTGNLAAFNQVSGESQNNMKQLESVLSIAVAAGFDKSRTAQMFVSNTASLTEALKLNHGETAAGELSSAIKFQGLESGADYERAMKRSMEGILGYNQYATQQTGWVGANRQVAVYGAGADFQEASWILGMSPAASKEWQADIAGKTKRRKGKGTKIDVTKPMSEWEYSDTNERVFLEKIAGRAEIAGIQDQTERNKAVLAQADKELKASSKVVSQFRAQHAMSMKAEHQKRVRQNEDLVAAGKKPTFVEYDVAATAIQQAYEAETKGISSKTQKGQRALAKAAAHRDQQLSDADRNRLTPMTYEEEVHAINERYAKAKELAGHDKAKAKAADVEKKKEVLELHRKMQPYAKAASGELSTEAANELVRQDLEQQTGVTIPGKVDLGARKAAASRIYDDEAQKRSSRFLNEVLSTWGGAQAVTPDAYRAMLQKKQVTEGSVVTQAHKIPLTEKLMTGLAGNVPIDKLLPGTKLTKEEVQRDMQATLKGMTYTDIGKAMESARAESAQGVRIENTVAIGEAVAAAMGRYWNEKSSADKAHAAANKAKKE